MELLPQVKKYTKTDTHVAVRNNVTVFCETESRRLLAICADAIVKQAGINLNIKCGPPRAGVSGAIITRVNPRLTVLGSRSKEAFRLEIGRNILVEGVGRQGLFYGMQTLIQLVRQSGKRLEGCVIEDYPDLNVRMVMYDFGRANHIRMEHLQFVIDRLAEYKVNAFMPYLENHFVFTRRPQASAYGAMTPAEAREIDRYCGERFIEVIPQFNAYGHNDDMLSNWRNRHLADNPYSPYQLCATNPEAVQTAKDIITEMSGAFRTKYFHAGGDETSPPADCPTCGPVLKKLGPAGLYAMHYGKIHAHLRKLGKRMMMWGDVALHYRDIADKLPKDIVIFDWHYEGSSPDTIKFFRDKGFTVYACPSDWTWYSTFTAYTIPSENILRFIPDAYRNGATGACMTVWEMYQGHYFNNNWFGIVLSAEAMWNAARIRYSKELVRKYEASFARLFFGTNDIGYTEILKQLEFKVQEIFPTIATTPPLFRHEILTNSNPYMARYLYGQDFTAAHHRKLSALFDKSLRTARRFRKTVQRNAIAGTLVDYPALFGKSMIERIRLLNEISRLYREMYSKQGRVTVKELESKLGVCVKDLRILTESSAKLADIYKYAFDKFGAPPENLATMKAHEQVFRTYTGYMEYHWKNFRKGVKLVPPATMRI